MSGSQAWPLLGSGLSCSRVTLLCPCTSCLRVCSLLPSMAHPWGQDSHEQTQTSDSLPLTDVLSPPHCPSLWMFLFTKHILTLGPLLVPFTSIHYELFLKFHCYKAHFWTPTSGSSSALSLPALTFLAQPFLFLFIRCSVFGPHNPVI